MNVIGGRKKTDRLALAEQVLGYALLGVRALMAQRVARKAYRGYKWMRRLPFLVAGAAILAFVARKAQQKRAASSDADDMPPTAASTSSAPASTPSTPTPTGSPTAVTPAPTATEDGAPEAGSEE